MFERHVDVANHADWPPQAAARSIVLFVVDDVFVTSATVEPGIREVPSALISRQRLYGERFCLHPSIGCCKCGSALCIDRIQFAL